MPAPLRAIRDERVLAAWKERLAGYRPSLLGPAAWVGGAAIVNAIAWKVLSFGPLLPVAFACVAVSVGLLVGARWQDHLHLRCPNCGGKPISSMSRESPRDAESCAQCNYWLRAPW